MLKGALQSRRRVGWIQDRLSNPLLVLHRESDQFNLFDGTVGGFTSGRDHEISQGPSFELGRALQQRMHFSGQSGFKACSGGIVSGSRHRLVVRQNAVSGQHNVCIMPTEPPFRFEQLADHDRSGFSSGEPALDAYLQTQATQDIRRLISTCFVAIETASEQVVGFYTLAAASIVLDELPPKITKKLPRYPSVPAVRIGRIAVSQSFQNRGLGSAMVADAAARTLDGDIGAFALIVDSKNERATAFYRQFGFIDLESRPGTLFLPLATVKKIQR